MLDELAKELKIRKRITAIYNKRAEDFATKEEWDDYLENLEDIIYNLSNGVDVQQTETKVTEYERANRASIIANQARQLEEQRAAQKAAFQAAAQEAQQQTVDTAAAGYIPSAAAMGTGLAAQPLPVRPPNVDAHGNLVIPPSARRLPHGSLTEDTGAKAAGLSTDICRMRALQEAFGSLLFINAS